MSTEQEDKNTDKRFSPSDLRFKAWSIAYEVKDPQQQFNEIMRLVEVASS